MKRIYQIAMAVTLASITTVSHAGVKLSATNGTNFTSAATTFLPLNAAGATTVSFNLTAAKKMVLTFSTECSVDAPAGNSTAWVDIDIIVNGAVVSPTTGALDGFCSANGTAGFDGWETNSMTVVIPGIVGANSVRIQARLNAGATGLWFGERSLVVHD
jgi:hypothetical protein